MYINNELYKKDIEKVIVEDFSLFKNKSIFITGASGLVGSAIVDILMFLNEKFNCNINIYGTFSNERTFENAPKKCRFER